MKKKNILIACAVAFGLALVAIGTYAFLTMNLFTANSIYNTSSTCFVVDYGVTNDDSTSDITGVLFPGLNATAKGSLKGKVSLKINSSCDDINGLGSLYLHLNTLSGSSLTNELKLMSTITTAHCENPYTLQTLNSYQTSSACTSAGGTWVTSTSALKYAIYDNAAGTGEPLKVGNIASDSVNTDILVYDNISITRTQKSYYIFIWLDGYLTDNTYVDLGFSGNLNLTATQAPSPVSFATDSWDIIISNLSSEVYKVGDTREITLTGFTNEESGSNGLYTIRIANKSTPSECNTTSFSQTACGFVIEFEDIITTHNINSTFTNVGGWPASAMYSYLNPVAGDSSSGTIYNSLPSEIKKSIINTYVVSGHGSGDTSGSLANNNFGSTDKLYLLSEKEVWNSTSLDTAASLSRQLDYYYNLGVTTSNYASAIKKRNGSAYSWWLRPAHSNHTTYFLHVYGDGCLSNSSAPNTYGVVPAFRIG